MTLTMSSTETAPRSSASAGDWLRTLTVMLVDDQAAVRAIVRRALFGLGVTSVVEASDGQGALELLNSDRGRASDLIICDLNMPRMDGLALCNALRRDKNLSHKLPIIILTASRDELLAEVACQVGAAEVLHKPVSPADLQAAMERLIGVRFH